LPARFCPIMIIDHTYDDYAHRNFYSYRNPLYIPIATEVSYAYMNHYSTTAQGN
jgi:hypothetical protein